MHGIIFFLLNRFVESSQGEGGWSRLFEEAGISLKTYSPAKAHSDDEFIALVEAGARIAGLSKTGILESFGEYIGPELLALHPKVIRPEWKTLDVVANAEESIHSVVRAKNPGASPPLLKTQRTSANEVQLVYSSPRKLCAVAKGMVRGLAEHYGELIEIEEETCMKDGDPFCSITFTQQSQASQSIDSSAKAAEVIEPTPMHLKGDTTVLSMDSHAPALISLENKLLGTYRVIGRLGNGGMGDVFRAEDLVLNREVAIKTLRPELSSNKTMRDRFVREARSMGALNHENVMPIFHIGYHEHMPYIVMPLLPGTDLEKMMKASEKPKLSTILRIGFETAAALSAAHKKGLIHRDVKPSNIWLEAPTGKVKLMDFGLSCSMDKTEMLTVPGSIIGTPVYMAPEGIDGHSDARSDLYSLGVVLYELVTGVQPFEGKTLSGTLINIATKQPDQPQSLVNSIPNALDELIMQLLEKDPDARIANAEELATKLFDIHSSL